MARASRSTSLRQADRQCTRKFDAIAHHPPFWGDLKSQMPGRRPSGRRGSEHGEMPRVFLEQVIPPWFREEAIMRLAECMSAVKRAKELAGL